MKKKNVAAIISLAFLFGACTPIGNDQADEHRELPYFGDHDVTLSKDSSGVQVVDTVHFVVPGFVFLNQDSLPISHRDYKGTIYVTDYFFTTCPTICPVMSSQMARLQTMVDKEGMSSQIKFLSHTVDPEHDTPAILKEYAERIGANLTNWNFVTGNKEELYDQARYGYFMTALESDTAAGGFFHSDNLVLIDRESHIRGYYDGTSTKEVDQLFEDIKLLIHSYDSPSTDAKQ